jgi:putative endonuclease
MYFAYVLENPKGILYKGSTDNLRRRILDEHNANKYKAYTRDKGPWKLFYFEAFFTREEAEAREKFFKSKAGWFFLKMILIDRSEGKLLVSEAG